MFVRIVLAFLMASSMTVSKLDIGFGGSALRLMKSYLTNRNQYVQLGETSSDMKKIMTGVPQGSILGPLLFSIYINDLTNASDLLEAILYADDTTLLFHPTKSVNNLNLSAKINSELDAINMWFRANKLSLNSDKTKYMIFHRPKSTPPNVKLKINGNDLEQVHTFKFLGLLLNENLTWTDHLQHIRIKISKSIGIINKLKHTLPKPILKTLYQTLILPHLNFQILNWGRDPSAENIFKLQKKAVRTISRAWYRAHTKPLFKSLGLLELNDLYKLSLLKFHYKFFHGLLPHYHQNWQFKRNCDYHDYFTRNRLNISSTKHNYNYYEELIRYQLISFRNTLPSQIHEDIPRHKIRTVSKRYKDMIINDYDPTCQIHNCFACNAQGR